MDMKDAARLGHLEAQNRLSKIGEKWTQKWLTLDKKLRQKTETVYSKVCPICKKEFQTRNFKETFCSFDCADEGLC
jgi:hypothetical protein